ncbi:MAG TPA: Tex-like N-terminal domain-containing protein, partial [Beijerinckiaceae bacterium]|nr:Tex-like N-terminal domain-containing protein [Beijerinckiaceae bacterium]
MKSVNARIATELGVDENRVRAAVELLDGGATVPFIARYRKEATGQLDDAQLRSLDERLRYLRDLDERREAILESIRAQGKLDASLERALLDAETKSRLEDIYLPFKPKRRSKAQIAIEAGLAPLAEALLASPDIDPLDRAEHFVDAGRGVETAQQALEGARSILVERFSENAALIGDLRERYWNGGRLVSKVREGKQTSGARFSDYFEWSEPFTKLPSHRILALYRGEKEEVLDLVFEAEPESLPQSREPGAYELAIASAQGVAARGRPGDKWLMETVRWAWRTKLRVHLALDLRMRLWQRAEDEAVKVFAGNLRSVLLAAPAGARKTLGLDPGFRTGVKAAVVDATGKTLATATIYPHEPQRRWDESIAVLARLCAVHQVDLIAIGNGTASRETDRLAGDLLARHP